jgi:DNA-binding MarR family transcriptional regulator
MSVKVMDWALKQPLRGFQKAVLIVLAYHADDAGKCWPGIALLATECGISRSSVTRHIHSLEDAKLLSKESRRDAKGYRRSNVYQLDVAHSVNSLHRDNQCRDIQPSGLESLSVSLTQAKVSRCHGNIIEQSLEPSKEQSDVSQIFAYWQTALGHPKAKLDEKRRRKIKQALKSYSVEDLCLAVDGCKASSWNMGDNPEKRIYDSIDLIFRDAEHIERFMGYVGNILPLNAGGNDIFLGAI